MTANVGVDWLAAQCRCVSVSNDLLDRMCTTFRYALKNSTNERSLGIRVAIPIVAILGRQRKLEIPIFRSEMCVDAESFSERQPLNPEGTCHWHQMKMMCPLRWRWLAEPVHHLGQVRKIYIPDASRSSNGGPGVLEGPHWGHDVNDGLCGKTRNRSASYVLWHSNEPGGQSVTKDLPFKLERLDPPRVVFGDLDQRFIHSLTFCGLTSEMTGGQ